MLLKQTTESGFSLIEVMIVMVVSSVVALSINQLTTNQFKNLKNFTKRMDLGDLRTTLTWRLNKPEVCLFNLKPGGYPINVSTLTTRNLTTLYYSNTTTTIMAQVNQRIPSSANNIKVSSITFGSLVRVGSTSEYRGAFSVRTDATGVPAITIPVSVLADSSGNVRGCNTPLSVDPFQGRIIEDSGSLAPDSSWYHGIYNIDRRISDLNPDFTSILLQGFCKAFDDGGNQYASVNVEFLDASDSNVGLFSAQICYQNTTADDEDFNRRVEDNGSIVLPKPSDTVKKIRFIFNRNTTSARSSAQFKTLK